MSEKLPSIEIESVMFWAVVTYELGGIAYFTGLYRAGAPYISLSAAEAARYNSQYEAERVIEKLPTKGWCIEQHLLQNLICRDTI